jgi:hypothetical protein
MSRSRKDVSLGLYHMVLVRLVGPRLIYIIVQHACNWSVKRPFSRYPRVLPDAELMDPSKFVSAKTANR